MPRHIAEGIETKSIVILKEVEVKNNIVVKEKEVIVKDENIQSGQLNFVNSKKAVVNFPKEFNRIPLITITMNDTSITNPYITNITKTNFTINFANNWTGQVSWVAIER